VDVAEFQEAIRRTFAGRDAGRGIDGTFRWMVEEVGELAKAIRGGDEGELRHEAGDVLAWLASVASLAGVDLAEAAQRYMNGCPRCGRTPCECPVQ
jgi:NTP pyrophosphatase (non-canonical NTP hydrolase)